MHCMLTFFQQGGLAKPGGRGALDVRSVAGPGLHLGQEVRHALAADALKRDRDRFAHPPPLV